MKLEFNSEYEHPGLEATTTAGEPMANNALDEHFRSLSADDVATASRTHLTMQAVNDYYLAKRFDQMYRTRINESTNPEAREALHLIRISLLRTAILSVAAANDNDRSGRTKSLPHLIQRLKELSPDDEEDLKDLQRSIDPNLVPNLKYVRHVRNKLVGHASHDPRFDTWAGTDEGVHLHIVEAALATLVRTHQALTDLINDRPRLGELVAVRMPDVEVGHTYVLKVAWENVAALAVVVREHPGRLCNALADQLGAVRDDM